MKIILQKSIIILLFFSINIIGLHAQMYYRTSQTFANPMLISPCFAGIHNSTGDLWVGNRQQWIGIEDNPVFMTVGYDNKISDLTSGWALMFKNENADQFRNSELVFNYTYHTLLSKEQKLSFSILPTFYSQRLVLSGYDATDNDDPFLQNYKNSSSMKLLFGFGIMYSNSNFNIGFNLGSLSKSLSVFNNYDLHSYYNYPAKKLHCSYKLKLQDNLICEPTLIITALKNSPSQIEFMPVFNYNEKYKVGVSIRNNFAMSMFAGTEIADNLSVFYSYDFGDGKYSVGNGGTHEIGLRLRVSKLIDIVATNMTELYNVKIDSLENRIKLIQADLTQKIPEKYRNDETNATYYIVGEYYAEKSYADQAVKRWAEKGNNAFILNDTNTNRYYIAFAQEESFGTAIGTMNMLRSIGLRHVWLLRKVIQ